MRHLVIFSALALAGTAHAQTGYRNLDRGRPSVVADAYGLERYGFEVSGGYRLGRIGPSRWEHVFDADLSYGVNGAFALGLEAPFAVTDLGARTESGFSTLAFYSQMLLTAERNNLPALALRADVVLPVMSGVPSRVGILYELLGTRSLGRYRAHLNAAIAPFHPGGGAAIDGFPEWRLALGFDRTLIRNSLLLIAEIGTERELHSAYTSTFVGLGMRRQLTPTLVLDAGVSLTSGADYGESALTFGLSHGFAIAGLVPGTRSR